MELALAALLISSLTCVGLLALWAATSSRHWFLRTAVFVGAISLLLLIPAYEPFVAFTLQGAVVAGGIHWARRRSNKSATRVSEKTHYSLATLMQLMTLFAVFTAVGIKVYQDEWLNWVSALTGGLVAGFLTLLACWLVYGRGNMWRRVAIGALYLILVAATTFWWDPPILDSILVTDESFNTGVGPWPMVVWLIFLSSIVAVACLWLILWQNLRRSLVSFVLVSTAIVTPSTWVYYRLMRQLPIPVVTLPETNGYQALVEAGIAIECRAINFHDTTPIDVLASEVASREELYVKARRALQQQVVVPVSYGFEDIDTDASGALRTLCRALAARARVAIEQEDYDEALKCNADICRLGQMCSTNGLLIHWLVGSAIKSVGLSRIYNMRDRLSSEQCLSTIRELAKTEKTPTSHQDMLHRERVWTEHTGGFYGQLTLILEDVAGDQRWAETIENIFCRDAAESRLLQCELALHAYSQGYGDLPNQLSEVVPRYLDVVPVDPFDPNGQLVRYRRLEDGYLLYSVGPNRVDDHGAIPDPNSPQGMPDSGDLRLDVLYAPYEEEPTVEDTKEESETAE